jgi:hypothetical protein
MLRHVALVITDVSGELTKATRRNIQEDVILQTHWNFVRLELFTVVTMKNAVF